MLDFKAKNWLKKKFKDQVFIDEQMKKHTSFKIGGPADVLIFPNNINVLKEILEWIQSCNFPFLIIGGGTNILVSDKGIRGVVISLSNCFDYINLDKKNNTYCHLSAGSGVKLKRLCSFALHNGFDGMNFALGIPGNLGGSIIMNAGTASGCIYDILESIETIDLKGKIENIKKQELNAVYRNIDLHKKLDKKIITNGYFKLKIGDKQKIRSNARKLIIERKKKQPVFEASAGSFFKNPSDNISAGKLIEDAGLKGKIFGGAKISHKHANFIINYNNAKASDVISLMKITQENVFKLFNIHLEPEVKILEY